LIPELENISRSGMESRTSKLNSPLAQRNICRTAFSTFHPPQLLQDSALITRAAHQDCGETHALGASLLGGGVQPGFSTVETGHQLAKAGRIALLKAPRMSPSRKMIRPSPRSERSIRTPDFLDRLMICRMSPDLCPPGCRPDSSGLPERAQLSAAQTAENQSAGGTGT
jgi:hypothetical protein